MASITVLAPCNNDRIGHKLVVMQITHSIRTILNRWPSRRAVYEDALAADPSLDMIAVHRWFQRGSLPSKYDAALIDGACRRGIGLHAMEIVKARSGHADQAGHATSKRQDYKRKNLNGAS